VAVLAHGQVVHVLASPGPADAPRLLELLDQAAQQ
jgi:hypothetical protein